MFKIDIDISDKELKKVTNMASVVRLGLLRGIKRSMIFAEGEAKKNFGGPGQLRIRSGHLRRSIKSQVLDRGLGKEIVGIIGSNVVYSAVHEYGYPPKNIPARPYIGPAFNNKNMIEIRRIIQKAIKDAIRRRGYGNY